jgi:saccharopine dehydrogenase-like NADP-dependent oxidoreductase
LIRGTLRYQGFPKFAKTLVNLGFLNDSPLEYLDPKSSPITWAKVLQKITGAKSDSEKDLIIACIEMGKIPEAEHYRIIQGLRW